MEKFLTFDDYTFIKETENILYKIENREKTNYKKLIIDALIDSNTLDEMEQAIVTGVANNNLYEQLWEGNISESQLEEILNEDSIFNKVVDWGKKKIELAKEKGKSAVDATTQKIAKIASSISSFVGMIMKALSSFLKGAWDYIKNAVEKRYSSIKEKVVKKGIESLKGKGDKLTEEVKNLGTTITHSIGWCTKTSIKKVGEMVKTAGGKDVNESVLSVIEEGLWIMCADLIKEEGISFIDNIDNINESDDAIKVPYLSKIAKTIGHLPFFKQFHDIEKTVKKIANTLLEKLTQFVSKVMNGPGPFEFVLFGTIAGMIVGYKIEHAIHHGVEHVIKEIGAHGIVGTVAVAIPFIGWILNMMFYTASCLSYWGVGQAIAGVLKGELKIDQAIQKAEEKANEFKPEEDKEDDDPEKEKEK
jgi:hypothetical protein